MAGHWSNNMKPLKLFRIQGVKTGEPHEWNIRSELPEWFTQAITGYQ